MGQDWAQVRQMRWETAIQAVVPVGQGVGEEALESTHGEDGPEAGAYPADVD